MEKICTFSFQINILELENSHVNIKLLNRKIYYI